MKLLPTLLCWRRPALPAVDDAVALTAEPAAGCGWFESSHELQTGLQVREHAANDAVCAELPLAMWFELQPP